MHMITIRTALGRSLFVQFFYSPSVTRKMSDFLEDESVTAKLLGVEEVASESERESSDRVEEEVEKKEERAAASRMDDESVANAEKAESDAIVLWIEGSYGKQQVTVLNHDRERVGSPIIVTYHDFGMNHSYCFDSFFSIVLNYKTIFEHFTIIHIDAPGHSYHCADALKSHKLDLKVLGSDLHEIVNETLNQLEISVKKERRKLIGLAIGASCHILYHSIGETAQLFDGIVCVNPLSPSTCKWSEWLLYSTRSEYLTDYLLESQANLKPIELIKKYEWIRLNKGNLMAYLRGYLERTEIVKAKRERDVVNYYPMICVLISDYLSREVMDNSVEFQFRLPRQIAHYTTVKSHFFQLLRHDPHAAIDPIERFLNTLGLYQDSLDRSYGKKKDM